MNDKKLKTIIKNYISNYSEILQDASQSHLWRTAARFKDLADDALNALEDEFADKLFALSEQAKPAIDGKFIQPMSCINDLASRDPDALRQLLKSLFAPDWDNMGLRQSKINTFVSGWNELQSKYFPCNIRYYMTYGKAFAILFMYDPDCSYMYHEGFARFFAECVEFEEDWGTGEDFDCKVYYKMCEELAEYIRSDQQLIFTSCGRYQYEAGLYPDMNYHLLAYDIMACNAKYKLYNGIKFTSKALEENKEFRGRQQEALICFQKYRDAWEKAHELAKGSKSFSVLIKPGACVSHAKMGNGTIETVERDNAVIVFEDGARKKFNLMQSVLCGLIQVEKDGFDEWKAEFITVMSRKNDIRNQLETVSRQLEGCISILWGA